MKIMFLFLILVISFAASAEETRMKHLISVGTDGFGWSGMGKALNWNSSKTAGAKDGTASESSFQGNYSYIFSNRIMLGFDLSTTHSHAETKLASGAKKEDDRLENRLALAVGYNFNEDLLRSWWVKGSYGFGRLETETKDSTATPDRVRSRVTEDFFGLELGKRISLESWGLKNVTYSPSIKYTLSTYGKDADETGLEDSRALTLNIIKIDILF